MVTTVCSVSTVYPQTKSYIRDKCLQILILAWPKRITRMLHKRQFVFPVCDYFPPRTLSTQLPAHPPSRTGPPGTMPVLIESQILWLKPNSQYRIHNSTHACPNRISNAMTEKNYIGSSFTCAKQCTCCRRQTVGPNTEVFNFQNRRSWILNCASNLPKYTSSRMCLSIKHNPMVSYMFLCFLFQKH
jgi:hypothetical protein